MCNYSQLFILFLFLGHPVLLQHTLNMFTYMSGLKGSKKDKAQKENIYRRATFLLRSNMCIFSQLFIVFSIFRTPCVVKYDFKPYIYIFLTQGCQEPPIYLGLTFQASHSTCKTTQHSKNALQGPPLHSTKTTSLYTKFQAGIIQSLQTHRK